MINLNLLKNFKLNELVKYLIQFFILKFNFFVKKKIFFRFLNFQKKKNIY
jgi:hypothetical protein